jgi:hypothetical protein
LLLIAAMLPGCSVGSYFGLGSSGGDASGVAVEDSTGTTGATSVSLTRAKPLDAYVSMGGDIKRCWFNPVDGLLPKYVYRADVSPDGSKVQISVHQKIELGRAGMTTYVLDFKQSGPSTVIATENRTMPPDLAAKMQFDIDRWKRGQSDCSKAMPASVPKPAAIAR